MNFEFVSPVRVVFGNGKIKELGKIAKPYGDKAFIVTGRNSMKKHGSLESVINSLNSQGIESFVFDSISPNPLSDEVDQALDLLKRDNYNVIIGLGGGSVLDASKAISAGMGYDSIRELIGGKSIDSNQYSLPVIAIPTTSGTGAEVTKGAIITDTHKGLKSGVRGLAVFPKIALVDPELTHSMPPEVTRITGFDAFTHAVETYVSNSSNPITDACALQAVKYISTYLPTAIEMGHDRLAREKMALASLMAGINIANTGTCLPHRLQQAMGSVVEMPHAAGTATLYQAWLKRAYPHAKEKFDRISEILEPEKSNSYQPIINFMKEIGMHRSLSDFADKSQIDSFLDKVSGNLAFDPIPNIDRKLMREIYEESFKI